MLIVLLGVKPGRSWFLPAWVHSVPIVFLIDPGAVVSAISYECWRDLEKNGDRLVSLEPVNYNFRSPIARR